MKDAKKYKIIEGSIPVLLSASHVYAHKRPSLTMSYKGGEPFTDRIVEEICSNTGAWGIVSTGETEFDPNYHNIKGNPYKLAVAELLKKENITRFIDIHGLEPSCEYDLGIYYPFKYVNSLQLAKGLSTAVNKGKLKGLNVQIFRFPDSLQESLAEYSAIELKIPAIQIEVAKYIRKEDALRNPFIENISSFLIV